MIAGGSKIMFVRGDTTARDDEVAEAARVANPDEIDIDDDDDDDDDNDEGNYASPTSGEAYRDRRLTTNFEL